MRQASGAISVLLGVWFGVPCVFGLLHFIHTGQVWTFLGFPTYGEGPFQRIGVPTSVALLAGFVAVCVAEVAVGALLLAGVAYAPAASYLILPFELAYWVGFALPFGPLLGLARTALLLLDRRRQPGS